MNEPQLQKHNTLSAIKEKFYSGKAAFEKADLDHLYKQFEDELNNAVNNKAICKDAELTDSWLEIFKAVSEGYFAGPVCLSDRPAAGALARPVWGRLSAVRLPQEACGPGWASSSRYEPRPD